MNGKNLTLSLAVVTLLGTFAFAQEVGTYDAALDDTTKWHSLFGSTHKKLAKEAIKRIDKNQYPDIDKASSILKDGAVSESGHPNFRKDNGGFPKALWETGFKKNSGGVLVNYKTLNTEAAYHSLGVICHLTQDQAVPAHAANIEHFTSEGLEAWADLNFQLGAVPEIDPSKQPYD